MLRRLTILLALCGGVLSPDARASAACNGTVEPSGPITIEVGSVQRLFVVRVPSGATVERQLRYVRVSSLWDECAIHGEPRVWPRLARRNHDLPRRSLAGGGGPLAPAWQGRPGEMGDRDILFFDATLDWLRAHHCVDERRVFVLGYSNGAGLASLLACERAGAIAGAAMAAGRPACAPGSSKPVIISHGMRDQTIGYEQAIQAAQVWSKRNGCSAPPKVGAPGCFAAGSCTSAPTTMCTHTGGHEYGSTFTRSVADFFRAIP